MINICLALVFLISLNAYIVDGRSTKELSPETQRFLNQLSKKIKTLSYAAPQFQNELPQTLQPTPYNAPSHVAKLQYQKPTVPQYQQATPEYQAPKPQYQSPKPHYQVPKQQTLTYGKPNKYYSSAYSANDCNGRPVDTKFPNPSNPNQFFVCTEDGSLVSMYCPDALVFSTITGRCEYSLQGPFGCESSPCQNNGVCLKNGVASYICKCAPGYSGPNCEQVAACSSSACQDGVCVPMPAGSPVTNYCLCLGGSRYGVDCSTAAENPCLRNGGGSLLLPSHINPALFAQCEGNKLYVKFCSFPLVFNAAIQRCDWGY